MDGTVVGAVSLGVVGLLGVGLLLALRSGAKALRERNERLRARGFEPVEDPDLGLRLTLHLRGQDRHRAQLSTLLERRDSGYTIAVCDVEWPGEDTKSWAGTVLVRSDRLDLPRFVLLPRISEQRPNAEFRNGLIEEKAKAWGARLVRLDTHPEVASRYAIGSDDPERLAARFDDELMRWLAETESFSASGEGDLLMIWPDWLHRPSWAPESRIDFELRLEYATLLFEHLRSRS